MVSLSGAAPSLEKNIKTLKRVKWRRATGRYREGTKTKQQKDACQLPKSKDEKNNNKTKQFW